MGQVLEFEYEGGSHPGELRSVYFPTDPLGSKGSTMGFDLDINQVRRFYPNKMKKLKVADAILLDTDKLPKNFDARPLVTGYKQEGKLVTTYGSVIIAREKKVRAGFKSLPGANGFEASNGDRSLLVTIGTNGVYKDRILCSRKDKSPNGVSETIPFEVNIGTLIANLQWLGG